VPLQKRWRSLNRSTVGSAPDRYGGSGSEATGGSSRERSERDGVYELGDGEVLEVGWGVLRGELKDALASSAGEQVRWEDCQTKAEVKELAAENPERAGLYSVLESDRNIYVLLLEVILFL
jgi:hypothetical protein